MKTIIMSHKFKKELGILSFIPLACFSVPVAYYLFSYITLRHSGTVQLHIMATAMSEHFGLIFTMLIIYAIIATVVLFIFVIHTARISTLNGQTKALWILCLIALVPVSFPLYWLLQIRHEPYNEPVKPI